MIIHFTFCHDPLGVMGRKFLFAYHTTRSHATTVASLNEVKPNEVKPNAVLSFSAVLRQVSLGLLRLLFPSRAQVNASLGCWMAFILRMWSINLQRRW